MEINYLAILVAGIASTALGALWYSPALFGKRWMAFAGMREEHITQMALSPLQGMAIGFVSTLVTAYVLARLIDIYARAGMAQTMTLAGIHVALLVWFGFYLTTQLGSVLWEGKPWGLWMLNSSYWLLSLLLMGAIIGAWV